MSRSSGSATSGQHGWRSDLAGSMASWAVARVIVMAALGVALYIAANYRGVDATLAGGARGYWGWDAGWYRAIATRGYGAIDREALRFFPLYPMASRALGMVLGGRFDLALVLVANAAALVTGVGLTRLAVFESADPEVVQRVPWALALFPVAFVLVIPYSEALFMALTASAFLTARSRRWPATVVLAVLAGLTRPLGVLLMAPLAIEAFRDWSGASARERLARLGAVIAPAVGVGAYLGWVGVKFGDPLIPVRVQQRTNLRGGLAPPSSTFVHALSSLTSGTGSSGALHLVWFAVFAVLVVVALRRWPASYGVFAGLTLVVSVSFASLDSLERYCFAAFPFVLAAASLVRNRWERALFAIAGAGLFAYAFLALLGPYVP